MNTDKVRVHPGLQMLNLGVATVRRMLLDLKILIPLLIIPIAIIFAFALMTQKDSQSTEDVKVRIAVDESLPAAERRILERTFRLIVVEGDGQLEQLVSDGKVIAAYNGEKVFATQERAGSWVLDVLQGKAPMVSKTPTVLTAAQKQAQTRAVVAQVTNFLINYMMFSLLMVANELLSLKNSGLLSRMSSMPMSHGTIVGGHLLAFTLLLGAQVGLINLLIYGMYGMGMVSFVNIPLAILSMLVLIFVILSLGVAMTRVTDNVSLLPMVANLVMIPSMMVSGTFMNFSLGPFFDPLRYATPQFWMKEILNLLNDGQINVMLPLLALFAMGTIFFMVGTVGNTKLFQE